MDKKLKLKLLVRKKEKYNGIKMEYSHNFSDVLKRANEVLPTNQSNELLQLKDEKSNNIICNQGDYENLSKIYNNGETIRIILNVVNKDNNISKEMIKDNNNIKEINKVGNDSIKKEIKDNDNNIKEIIEENNSIKETKEIVEDNSNIKEITNDNIIKEEKKDDINDNNAQESVIDSEKIKNDIRVSVQSKIKEIESSLFEKIFESVKNQLKEEISNNNIDNNEVIHKNIKCNNCNNDTDIKGIRYKCTKCENYNLCSKCEALNIHNFDHILIKIRNPIIEENELNSKIKNLNYKNSNYNYTVNIQDKVINSNKCTLMVLLSNIGNDIKSGWCFKWLEGSEIKGNDYKDTNKIDIKKDGSTIIELVFEEGDKKNESKEYNVYYQLLNSDEEVLGNIVNFKVSF